MTDIAEAEELILRNDSATGDLGYPHAIQLDNGDIVPVSRRKVKELLERITDYISSKVGG